MTKKLRPSLKDYLKTGKISAEPFKENAQEIKQETKPETTPDVKQAVKTKLALDKVFLSVLSPADKDTWSPVLNAGIDVRPLFLSDIESLREDFLSSDNTRFTFYILHEKGAPLQMVIGESQIQEPFVLVSKWDETGVLSICFSF
ncbi:hypothetical protein FACS1894204_12390 [Synergistales bacterium]|nr:hypothetical protein FACS1894204_12390 [Synergistales bacterium]